LNICEQFFGFFIFVKFIIIKNFKNFSFKKKKKIFFILKKKKKKKKKMNQPNLDELDAFLAETEMVSK
jgi:hypothetical protein